MTCMALMSRSGFNLSYSAACALSRAPCAWLHVQAPRDCTRAPGLDRHGAGAPRAARRPRPHV